ncbi:hypothetical protein Tco_0522193 [Tanacetum coccineum]
MRVSPTSPPVTWAKLLPKRKVHKMTRQKKHKFISSCDLKHRYPDYRIYLEAHEKDPGLRTYHHRMGHHHKRAISLSTDVHQLYVDLFEYHFQVKRTLLDVKLAGLLADLRSSFEDSFFGDCIIGVLFMYLFLDHLDLYHSVFEELICNKFQTMGCDSTCLGTSSILVVRGRRSTLFQCI